MATKEPMGFCIYLATRDNSCLFTSQELERLRRCQFRVAEHARSALTDRARAACKVRDDEFPAPEEHKVLQDCGMPLAAPCRVIGYCMSHCKWYDFKARRQVDVRQQPADWTRHASLDQTSLVVHRLSHKLLWPSEKEHLPSRTALRKKPSSLLDTIGTDINVDLSAGGSRKMRVIRPQEAIPYLIQNVQCFRTIFETTLRTFPCTPSSPWTLEYHEDEITPGNPMRPDNKRKFHIIYCTFLELDISSWSDGWLPLAVVRSTEAQKFRGAFFLVL